MVRLSVIIPVYKAGEYINKSSDSILNNSYKDLELILVDDGSPDNSGELCEQIAAADSRVRVIHKQNGGISSARNAGIKAARGEYIAFVDQDDTVREDMYERLMTKAAEGYDIVVSDFLLVYPDNEVVYRTFDVHGNHDDTYRDMLLKGYGCNIWNMVARRSVVVENDISFPEHLRHCEDVWFSLRLHLCTDRIAKISEPFYIYNLANPNQVSNNLDERFNQCCLQCFTESIPYMEAKGAFPKFKNEVYWNMLLVKTNWVLSPEKFSMYHSVHPEINSFVKGNPLLSKKMRLIMNLLNYHLDFVARILIRGYKLAR